MHQLPEDINLYIFNLTRNMDDLYNLIQLNKFFYTIYINKYKIIVKNTKNINKLFYTETVWFM